MSNLLDETPSMAASHLSPVRQYLRQSNVIEGIVHRSGGLLTHDEVNDQIGKLMEAGASFDQAAETIEAQARIASILAFYGDEIKMPRSGVQLNHVDWVRVEIAVGLAVYVWTLRRPFKIERFV